MSTKKMLSGSKASKKKERKPGKRSLGAVLLVGLAGILLEALKWKWKCDIWEPGS